MDENGLAGLKPGIVEQHMLDRAEGDGRHSGADLANAGRRGDQKPSWQVDLLLREAVEVETMDAGNMLAEIVAAFATGAAEPAGAGPVDRHQLPGDKVRDAASHRLHLP